MGDKRTNKKILITGGCGFVGSNLARALLRENHTVSLLDDLSVGSKDYIPEGIYNFYDVKTENLIFFQGDLDLIIHLASRKIPREGRPDLVLKENALGIIKVVELARQYDARIIYLSSSEVYGLNHTCLEEFSGLIFGRPDDVRWSYGLSKAWSENYLFGSEGIRFNIIRLFATYGSYNCRNWRAGPVPVFIEQGLSELPFTIDGDGSQIRAFQYIDDAVDGIMRIINRNDIDREIYNIGNPDEPVTINHLAEEIGTMIASEKYGMIHPVLPDPLDHRKQTYQEIQKRVPDISKAEKQLGFNPKISLNEGLKRTILWHKEEREIGVRGGIENGEKGENV